MSTQIGHDGNNEFWGFIVIMAVILIAMAVLL